MKKIFILVMSLSIFINLNVVKAEAIPNKHISTKLANEIKKKSDDEIEIVIQVNILKVRM